MTAVREPGTERATLADKIYARLQDEIMSGQLEPGSHLRIAQIAGRFGTSQAPVREALRRLTEEGLAVTEPYVGTVLKEPSLEEVEEIYLLRQELEAYAVRRILSQPSVRFRPEPIKRALRDLQRAARAGDPAGIMEADLAFHRAVCAAADSALTLEVWSMITKRVRGARISYERTGPDDLSTIVELHRSLLEALEAGDPQAAEQAFRQHLASAVEAMRARRERVGT